MWGVMSRPRTLDFGMKSVMLLRSGNLASLGDSPVAPLYASFLALERMRLVDEGLVSSEFSVEQVLTLLPAPPGLNGAACGTGRGVVVEGAGGGRFDPDARGATSWVGFIVELSTCALGALFCCGAWWSIADEALRSTSMASMVQLHAAVCPGGAGAATRGKRSEGLSGTATVSIQGLGPRGVRKALGVCGGTSCALKMGVCASHFFELLFE